MEFKLIDTLDDYMELIDTVPQEVAVVTRKAGEDKWEFAKMADDCLSESDAYAEKPGYRVYDSPDEYTEQTRELLKDTLSTDELDEYITSQLATVDDWNDALAIVESIDQGTLFLAMKQCAGYEMDGTYYHLATISD